MRNLWTVQLAIKPSYWIITIFSILWGISIGGVWYSFWGASQYILIIMLLLSMVLFWVEYSKVTAVHIYQKGIVKIALDDQSNLQPATLKQGVASRWGMILCWKTEDGAVHYHIILPHMTDKEAYRRLLVWVWWCQEDS